MRARTQFEEIGKDKQALIVDELPYQVNKRVLLEKIAELVTDKRLEGVSDIRDESDKSGMRAVIELKRGEIPEVVLNNLYKMTQLQDAFHMNMVALVDGQPRLLNLKELIESFISHRREVVTRRTVFELRKARERGHVLEGLAVALSNVDAVIELIKKAPAPADAKRELMARTWQSDLVRSLIGDKSVAQFRPEGLNEAFGLKADGYHLSDEQTQAILELRLQRLTGLEQDKIRDEYREVMTTIADLIDILAKPARITKIISDELNALKQGFGDAR
jgi:DNA gyrase subunit A